MTSQINENIKVSGQMSTAPEDALMGETGRAVSPTTGANLPGDTISALNSHFCNQNPKLRLSIGLSKQHMHSNTTRNYGFKAPKFVNVKTPNPSVVPLPCPGTKFDNEIVSKSATTCLTARILRYSCFEFEHLSHC